MMANLICLGTTDNFHYWLDAECDLVLTSISPNPSDPVYGARRPLNRNHNRSLAEFVAENARGHASSWCPTAAYEAIKSRSQKSA
jgi:hypothetical protein